MSHLKTVPPILKPIHFDGLDTKLTHRGLNLTTKIGPNERQEEILEIADGTHDAEDVLNKLEQLRPFTKVIANPKTPSAGALLTFLCNAQATQGKNEKISIGYGLPKKYDRMWTRQHDPDGNDTEGQFIVQVAYNGKDPIGYTSLHITLTHDAKRKRTDVIYSLNLTYVHPNHRGEGYGIDLSIACGYLCRDVLTAAYRAVPPGYTITPIINADFESKGGERFTQQIVNALDLEVEMISINGKRKSIDVQAVDLDAGY